MVYYNYILLLFFYDVKIFICDGVVMLIGFSVAMLLLVGLFYLSNPKSNVNKWCAVSGFFFWVGIAKQAMMFEVVPMLSNALERPGLEELFVLVHSVCTWMIYALAAPTMVIAGFYFAYIERSEYFQAYPRRLDLLKLLVFVPGVVLLFFYSPWRFGEYQIYSQSFWITYTAYNFGFAAILTYLAARGIRIERNSKSSNRGNQRKLAATVMLPPLYYWLLSIFVVRLLDALLLIDLADFHQLWQANVVIVLVCIAVFIIQAFRDGFMGLRLISHTDDDWNTDMRLINASAAHTKHFLKSRVPLMEMYVEDLREQIVSAEQGKAPPKELDDLAESIESLKNFFDKILHHSQIIVLEEEGSYRLKDLLAKAVSASLHGNTQIETVINVHDNVFLVCDGNHMTEVFINVIKNAAEAIYNEGRIEITGTEDKALYYLRFRDNGVGINPDMLEKMFTPYESTKNQDRNFGLGLAYCKNVVGKHGGYIFVESTAGAGGKAGDGGKTETGTTITIALPRRRIAVRDGAGKRGSGV